MSKLKARLADQIKANGPLSLAAYMNAALSDPKEGYYMRRAPFGAPSAGGGDFTTAPEISQMFGELIGAWCVDLWARSGAPKPVNLVELGPGRGTLMADICRTASRHSDFTKNLNVHFVETSPTLRAEQKQRVAQASWHDSLATVPDDALTLVIANEFFDALPITQHARTKTGWQEITVTLENSASEDSALAYARAPEEENPFSAVQAALLPDAAPDEIIEASPVREYVMQDLCGHLSRAGGAALIIDYGYARAAAGDSFQAMNHHEFVDPLASPGEADLTAHVNFAVLSQLAVEMGLQSHPITQQGDFLRSLGLDQRAAQLAKASPEAVGKIMSERDRLAAPDQMGHLFKVLGVRHPDMPPLAGFEAGYAAPEGQP
jgi:SAM-dependent MidA family methyltransferase